MNMIVRAAGIEPESIVDGPGLRFALFVQGCPHRCKGCHNPQTWDFWSGEDMDTEEILRRIKRDPVLDGVTFSGGEPFCQPEPLIFLADCIRAECPDLDIMAYSGFTFEELVKKGGSALELLSRLDSLVDGRFVLERQSYELKFMGSSNQRWIDVPASLSSGKVTPMTDEWSDLDIRLI